MKKYLLLLIPCFALLSSCSRESVMLFEGKHEVYFNKFYMDEIYPGTASADSTTVSFFFYPTDTKNVEAKVVVNMTGPLLTSDLKFGLKVIEEGTTANPDEYTIDDAYVFHANKVGEDASEMLDTIAIKLHWSSRLDAMPGGVRLLVELVPGEEVGVGQFERRRAVIILTTLEAKPDWWTDDFAFSVLGKYSQKKYKLFLDNVDKNADLNADLIAKRPDLVIKLAMQFKQWLSEQNPAILDEDGSLMQVNL